MATQASCTQGKAEVLWKFWFSSGKVQRSVTSKDKQRKALEFGPFQIDRSERVLLRDGRPVVLSPKAFKTLVALVERSGHLVEKNELMKTVWPDTIVEEGNLSSNVSAIRKALGEVETGQSYIQTVSGLGYRFVGEVSEAGHSSTELIVRRRTRTRIIRTQEEETGTECELPVVPAHSLPVANTLRVNTHSRKTILLILALSVLTIGAASAAYFYFRASDKPKEAVLFSPVRSIAVLPLKPITTNDADVALSLGLADSLITRLGSSQQIIVRPVSAITEYSESEYDPLAVGQKLQADAVLEGSFQRANDRLRVNLKLLAVADGRQIWQGTFEETETDIFKLQDHLSAAAASALVLNLNQRERALIVKRYTSNAEAYEDYLKGRYFWNQRLIHGAENLARARAYFEKAVELDSQFALAYSGLAEVMTLQASINLIPSEPGLAHAKDLALKALELEPDSAEVLTTNALILQSRSKLIEAESMLKRAIELNPNYVQAYLWLSMNYTSRHKYDESLNALFAGQKVDPTSPELASEIVGVYRYRRQCDKALMYLQRAVELFPDISEQNSYAGGVNVECGNYEQGIRQLEAHLAAQNTVGRSREISTLSFLSYAYAKTGQRVKAIEILDKMKSNDSFDKFRLMAAVYAALGEHEKAIDNVEKQLNSAFPRKNRLIMDSRLDSLRSEPRFQEILQKLNH
jgi:DNA-binding winged helix-turn-helix (wHTH) protein/TolB-like protein/Tfp pilus assembly protein PilF